MNTQVSADSFEDRQFVVLASEKQARVVALPSQNCVYRQQLAETHIVIKAEVTSLKGIIYILQQQIKIQLLRSFIAFHPIILYISF